jgi:glycosyltransferase involved in cell wall biosynthesis
MKKILILVFSNLKHDARVTRQIQYFKKHFLVTVVCFDMDPIDGVSILKIKQTNLTKPRKLALALLLLFRQYSTAYVLLHNYSYIKKEIRTSEFDLIVANDIDTVPLAFRLAPNARVLLDAHEYAPRHFENSRTWKFFFQPFYVSLCKEYLPKITGMITVGKGLAKEYAKHFPVQPVIITNANRFHPLQPVTPAADIIKLVHHGIANPSRRLELMIDMMELLDDRFTLDLYLITSSFASPQTRAYVEALKETALNNPRIKIHPPVKSDEIVRTINQYDIGVFLLPPVNFNYENTLPNKLFDFIQARLAIAVGPSKEMAEIVQHYDLGVVSQQFTSESLAKELMQLTPQKVMYYKLRADQAAKDLNAEKNEIVMDALVNNILSK